MYSSYYTPKDGRQSTVLTDHEALHRDEATHKAIQSDESVLRPIDLETIMSNNKAVKFWYLHRPKTMEYVHKNATKIQSLGRAYAVRQLRKKHGAEYVVALAKADAEKKAAEKLAEMSDAERIAQAASDAEYEARVEESRRLRREQEERERQEEEALRARLAEEARLKEEAERQAREEEEERRRVEEGQAALAAAALAAEEAARLQAEEEERIRQEEIRRAEEEEAARLEAIRQAEEEEAARIAAEAAAEAARLEAIRQAEEEEAARIAAEEEAARAAEQARIEAEEEAARLEWEAKERARVEAEAAAMKAAEEKERKRLAAIEAEKMEKYEQSLSKDVPVVVRNHGPGRVVAYDKDQESYTVKMEAAMGGLRITVKAADVDLDDDRILSPRTKVDTPFGTGEVVGLDPHVGCYAINTEVNATDGDQFLAFVQIADVKVHEEEVEERAIVENAHLPIPDEIGLVSARIVDSRVVNRTGKKFIQYKLEIKTTNYGTVYCWKRYSTFRSLCERLTKEAGYSKKEIPELPKRHITGNFSQKTIGERAEKLNLFLNAAVKAEHLQWGIRVDDQIAVYKRRVKRAGDASSSKRKEQSSSRGIFGSRRR